MSGAIAERVLEFVAYLAGCVGRQPLQTDGGTRDVTTQTFKTLTLLRPAGNTFSEKPFLSTENRYFLILRCLHPEKA
jgi:hypothetical protein